MPAIDNFRRTIQRAEAMVELHKTLCPRGKPKVEHADILRAAVVIAVSAMDGFFHEKIVENVPRFVRSKRGKALPGKLTQIIKENTSHERLIEILFEERPLSHIATIVRKAIADRTYQDSSQIEQAVGILGVDDLWFNIGMKLKLSKEKAKTYVQPYVNRRHQIVHRGDFGETKKTKNLMTPISRDYAEKCVRDISRFVEAINHLIDNKLAKREKK